MRQIQMLDLASEFSLFSDDVRTAIDGVLNSQAFVNGPAVKELEKAMRLRVGTSHAIAVSSGTDALLCSLMALGIGHGDEVILPAFTFFASAGSVARTGATPVFVDIDPRTFNVDPSAIEAAVTSRTRAIMVVHLYGQCAEMDAIRTIADKHRIPIIEDAAQAIGATYQETPACNLGTMACVSFYPTKNLGGFGEGGMIFTNDEALGEVARQLRNHGESQRYVHERVGGNFRLNTISAAVLLVKLRLLDDFTQRRRRNASRYDELFRGISVVTPHVAPGQKHVYHQYTIMTTRRDALQAFLRERGIGSGIYYAVPLHLQKCFASLGYQPGSLPVTEEACEKVLSLPCHPMLCEEDVEHVAACVREFHAAEPKVHSEPASAGNIAGA